MDAGRISRARFWLLVAITVVLGGWALYATGAFMVPVIFSLALALLVAPLDRCVTQRLPTRFGWLGHVAAMGVVLVSLLLLMGMVWIAAQQLVDRFPSSGVSGSLLPQFGQEFRSPSGSSTADAAADSPVAAQGSPEGAVIDAPSSVAQGSIKPLRQLLSSTFVVEKLGSWASGMALKILGAASGTLFATVLVFFLTLIMLIEAPRWRQKIGNILNRSAHDKTMESIIVISRLLRRYLMARTVLGIVTAVLYIAWLWIFGVDLLVVWGMLTFVLGYLPTLGSLIAGALPVLYVVVQKDPGAAIAVGVGIFIIEQVMGNYIDPRVQGRQVSLSSLVVLIALLVWGWLWGIAGAILAVPITIAAMIICAHIESLRPFALMLSNASNLEELDRQVTCSD